MCSHFPSLIQSATRSASVIAVALVSARMTSGIAAAPTTRSRSRPGIRPCCSITAIGSAAGPALQAPEE
jgi:hypothetical protein